MARRSREIGEAGPSPEGVVSVRVLLGPFAYGLAAGLDPDVLARESGLDPSTLGEIDAFIPLSRTREVFARLQRHTADAAVGLRSAEHVPPEAFDLFRYGGRSCQDFGGALDEFVRWLPVLNNQTRPEVVRSARAVRLCCGPGPLELAGSHSSEYVIACTLRGFQEIATAKVVPLEIWFRHPRPRLAAPGHHEQFFGCPVRFGRPEDAILFPPGVDRVSTRQPDPVLNALLRRHVAELQKAVPRSADFRDQAERGLVSILGEREPTIGALAKRLGMSSRTLQRRLTSERTTFRRLLNEVRHRLAASYLLTPGVGIAEVAFLLGFGDVPAFHRAFRSWTGQAPGAYRRQEAHLARDDNSLARVGKEPEGPSGQKLRS